MNGNYYNPNLNSNLMRSMTTPATGMIPAQQAQYPQASPMQTPVFPQAPPVSYGEMVPSSVQPQLKNIDYTQGYLQTQIGRGVKIEFLIGTNMLVDREGTLVDVGVDYLIIQEFETDDLLLADMYSIKFIRFYY